MESRRHRTAPELGGSLFRDGSLCRAIHKVYCRTVHFRATAGACVGLLGLAISALGCRTECAADEKASRAQIEREQKAMLRGQGICRELLTPRLAVTDGRVVLSTSKDNVLAQRADVPLDKVTLFAPLFERLSGYRTHFKAVRADPFEPTLYVSFDPTLEPVKAATLLATAAYAGYPRSRLYTKNLELDIDWWMPPTREEERPSILCVEPRGDRGFAVRRDDPQAASAVAASIDTLGAEVASACSGHPGCADAVAIADFEGATVDGLARVALAVFASPPFAGRRPRLVFLSKVPVDPSTSAGARFARRPCAR
jgi:hypothetical protein